MKRKREKTVFAGKQRELLARLKANDPSLDPGLLMPAIREQLIEMLTDAIEKHEQTNHDPSVD